ncbi:MAG: TolC family protein [Candidatus Omnitrophota bacterium]
MRNRIKICSVLLLLLFLARGNVTSTAENESENSAAMASQQLVSLDECVAYSLKESFDVKIAKLDFYIADTQIMYSEAVFDTFLYGGAGYNEDKRQQLSIFAPDDNQTNDYYAGITKKLPTGTEVDVKFEDTRAWNNTIFVSKNPAYTSQLSVDLEQPVAKNFFGYVDRTNISITKLAVENADFETKDRIEAFIAEVEKAYWRLLFNKRAVEINQAMLIRARDLLSVNAKNFDMGIIEKGDLLASEANVIGRETDLVIIENSYRNAEESLKLLMNESTEVRIAPSVRFRVSYNFGDMAECLKKAFKTRRDYKEKKIDIDIKNLTLKIKDNLRWPEIDLTASFAVNGVESSFGESFAKTTGGDNTNMYAGIEVNIPLENNAAQSEYNRASYEKERAILSLKDVERTIITEVGNAFRDVTTYEKSVGNAHETVRLQSGKLTEEEKRFSQGRSNTKNLIDYQHDLLRSEIEEAAVMLSLETSRTDLERAMNTLLEKYERYL